MARNKNSSVNNMLTSNDKEKHKTKRHGPNGVLSRLFRTVLQDLNVNPHRFGVLMHQFIQDNRNGVPDNRVAQTSVRGNLRKELTRTQMTWKVFCKAMRFIQILNIEINIKLTHAKPVLFNRQVTRITYHSTSLWLGDRDEFDEFNARLEQSESEEGIGPEIPWLEPEPDLQTEESKGKDDEHE
jgi:hypothetical protein